MAKVKFGEFELDAKDERLVTIFLIISLLVAAGIVGGTMVILTKNPQVLEVVKLIVTTTATKLLPES